MFEYNGVETHRFLHIRAVGGILERIKLFLRRFELIIEHAGQRIWGLIVKRALQDEDRQVQLGHFFNQVCMHDCRPEVCH